MTGDAAPDTRETGRLEYPFKDAPGPGEIREITEGVYWLRVPMAGRLNHINVWLLEDGEGWTVVDTGMPEDSAREAWREAFKSVMGGRPVTRVIVTHLHPDHVGLAGWLCESFKCDLWMSRTDYLLCRTLVMDTGHKPPVEGLHFYEAAGLWPEAMTAYRENFGRFGRAVYPLPQSFHRLKQGDRLTIGAREWNVVVGSGHAPEHICLHCPALNLFISGDQILPRISSNVSVWPTEPDGNPLQDWLDSCARLKALLPQNVLVLPAHHDAFLGAHIRLSALIRLHEENLKRLREKCRAPQRAVDVFATLFRSQINAQNAIPAAGEAVAHLSCLVQRGQLSRTADMDGVYWYETKA